MSWAPSPTGTLLNCADAAGGEGSLKTSLRVFRGSKRAPALPQRKNGKFSVARFCRRNGLFIVGSIQESTENEGFTVAIFCRRNERFAVGELLAAPAYLHGNGLSNKVIYI